MCLRPLHFTENKLRKGNICLLVKTAVSKADFSEWSVRENNNIYGDNDGDNDNDK